MKKKRIIIKATIAVFLTLTFCISFTQVGRIQNKSLNSIAKVQAKVENEWCSTGVKDRDELYVFSFVTWSYVCSCQADFDDCCKCN